EPGREAIVVAQAGHAPLLGAEVLAVEAGVHGAHGRQARSGPEGCRARRGKTLPAVGQLAVAVARLRSDRRRLDARAGAEAAARRPPGRSEHEEGRALAGPEPIEDTGGLEAALLVEILEQERVEEAVGAPQDEDALLRGEARERLL